MTKISFKQTPKIQSIPAPSFSLWPPASCENFHEKSYGGETTKYQVPW